MEFFFHTPEKKNGEKIGIIYGGFFYVASWTFINNKLVHDI